MTIDPMPPVTSESTGEPAQPVRPRLVDWAIYAIFARCLLSLIAGALLFPFHDRLVRREHKLFPNLTDAQAQHAVGSAGVGVFAAVLMAGVCIALAKYIRDGRNWARWAYAVISVVIFRDIFYILLPLVHGYPLLLALAGALAGTSALAAIVLLFLRPSIVFFRESTNYYRARRGLAPSTSPMAALFRPRPLATPQSEPVAPVAPEATADGLVEPSSVSAGPAKRAPRSKSRRGAAE